MLRILAVAVLLAAASPCWADRPDPQEGDVVLADFRFGSGEILPALKIHYLTLGAARRNAAGEIVNGVLLLHGTSGTSKNWLQPTLADELFAPGAPLDAEKYFIVIPDGIGRGGSSKPSDGLRMKFPALPLRRHGGRDPPPADRASRPQASAARARHLDGRHAGLDVGRDVSRLHGRAGADREPADRDQRPQLDVPAHRHRGDPQRSRLERRQLRQESDALRLFGADRRADDRERDALPAGRAEPRRDGRALRQDGRRARASSTPTTSSTPSRR